MTRRERPAAVTLLVALLAAACGPDGRDGTAVATTDAPPWTLAEELRIGSMDDPDQTLTSMRPFGLLAFPDGRIWIHQIDDRQFRVYDADGGFLGRVGRRGQGPGEISAMREFGWWGDTKDTIWVVDNSLRRLSLFAGDGTFARSLQWELGDYAPVAPPGTWDPAQVIAVTAGGEAVGRSNLENYRESRLIRFDPTTGAVLGEIARLDRHDYMRLLSGGEIVRRASNGVPIPSNELFAFAPGGRWLVVADREAAGVPAVGRLPVHALDMNGDTLWSRSIPYTPVAIPPGEVDSIVDVWTSGLTTSLGRSGIPPSQVPRIVAESLVFPGHRPPIDDVFIDEDDRVWPGWIPPAEGEPATWLVLGEGGEPVGRVSPPPGIPASTSARRAVATCGRSSSTSWTCRTWCGTGSGWRNSGTRCRSGACWSRRLVVANGALAGARAVWMDPG